MQQKCRRWRHFQRTSVNNYWSQSRKGTVISIYNTANETLKYRYIFALAMKTITNKNYFPCVLFWHKTRFILKFLVLRSLIFFFPVCFLKCILEGTTESLPGGQSYGFCLSEGPCCESLLVNGILAATLRKKGNISPVENNLWTVEEKARQKYSRE